jgi:hypothetical protein
MPIAEITVRVTYSEAFDHETTSSLFQFALSQRATKALLSCADGQLVSVDRVETVWLDDEPQTVTDTQHPTAAAIGPARWLLCSCCGAETRGRQWHNRDTGYGLCVSCIQALLWRARCSL